MALIQRSCGYALRPTLSIADVQAAIEVIKRANPRVVVVVDNCYGEFTEDREPCSVRPTPSALTHARASGSAAVAASCGPQTVLQHAALSMLAHSCERDHAAAAAQPAPSADAGAPRSGTPSLAGLLWLAPQPAAHRQAQAPAWHR